MGPGFGMVYGDELRAQKPWFEGAQKSKRKTRREDATVRTYHRISDPLLRRVSDESLTQSLKVATSKVIDSGRSKVSDLTTLHRNIKKKKKLSGL
jgi:hypothetical protein